MKEIEFIIKPEKMENLKRILDNCGAHGVICTEKAATLDFSGVAAIFVTN